MFLCVSGCVVQEAGIKKLFCQFVFGFDKHFQILQTTQTPTVKMTCLVLMQLGHGVLWTRILVLLLSFTSFYFNVKFQRVKLYRNTFPNDELPFSMCSSPFYHFTLNILTLRCPSISQNDNITYMTYFVVKETH